MLLINNPENSYSEQRLVIGNSSVTLVIKYNVRNESWYLSILDSSGTLEYLSGVKIVPNQNLTGRYILDGNIGGDIWCLRVKNDYSPIDYNNLGRNKTYRLAWISDGDMRQLGVEDVIQL